VGWLFCRGFYDFGCAERGELRGKTWWSCGESMAGNYSKSAPLKHRKFLHIFDFFCGVQHRIDVRTAKAVESHAKPSVALAA
jgi:hypothetical protein